MLKALAASFGFSLTLLLSACGGGSSGGGAGLSGAPTAPLASTTAASNVVKGLIRNGVVAARRWQGGAYVELATARTDDSGNFTLTLPNAVPGEVLRLDLHLSTDTSRPTEMLCDVTACGNRTRGEWVPLTNEPGLASWASVGEDGALTIMPMTVVSTLLVEFAESAGAGHLDKGAIAAGRQRVAALFRLSSDDLMARPGNIVDGVWLLAASDSSLRLSLLSAAFAQLAVDSGQSLESVIGSYVQAFIAQHGHLLQDSYDDSPSLGAIYRGAGALVATSGSTELQARVAGWGGVMDGLVAGQLNSSVCGNSCGAFDSGRLLTALGTGADTLGGDLGLVMQEQGVQTLEGLLFKQLSQYRWLASADTAAVAQVAVQAVAMGAQAALGQPPAAMGGLTPVLDGNVLHLTGNQSGLDVNLDITVPDLLAFIASYPSGGAATFTFGASGALENQSIRARIDGSLVIDAGATNFLPLRNAVLAFAAATTPEARLAAQQGLMAAIGGIIRSGGARFTINGSAGIARLEWQGESLVETSRLAIEGEAWLQVDMDGGANGAIAANGGVVHGSITLPTGDHFEVNPALGHALTFALATDGTAQASFTATVLNHMAAVGGGGRLKALGPLLSNLRDGLATTIETGVLDINLLLDQLQADVGQLQLAASGQADIADLGHSYTMTLADGHMKISQPDDSATTALDLAFSRQGVLAQAAGQWWLVGLDLSNISSPVLLLSDSTGGEWPVPFDLSGVQLVSSLPILGPISGSTPIAPNCWGASVFC